MGIVTINPFVTSLSNAYQNTVLMSDLYKHYLIYISDWDQLRWNWWTMQNS